MNNESKSLKSNFKSDLEWGKYWEYATIKPICSIFQPYCESKDYFFTFLTTNESKKVNVMKEWDTLYIVAKKSNRLETIKRLKFEIKADKYDSNNVYIEKKCNKKLSGVFATKSDYFVYVLPKYNKENVIIIKPSELIKILEEKYNHCLSYGGDGGRAYGYVINKNEFVNEVKKVGKVIDWECTIPEKFEVEKHTGIKGEKSTTYYGHRIPDEYPDPFDWE